MFLLIQLELAAALFLAYFTGREDLFFNSKSIPVIMWKKTAKARTGCIKNWMAGFVPMKWETSLNESGLSTESELITRCCRRKTSKKNPERAMLTFLATDDDIEVEF